MKKSNALMLSYMIFLAITLLAYVIFKWNGLDKIAIAATVAGYFFALADLYDWRVTFNNYTQGEIKQAYEKLYDIEKRKFEFLNDRDKELQCVLNKAIPYEGKDSELDNIIQCFTTVLNKDETLKEKHEKSKKEFSDAYEDIRKEKEKTKKLEKIELVIMILGFVSFFSIIVFDYLVTLLKNCQSGITIVAFIAIMFNYYLKDVIEEKYKLRIKKNITEAEKTEVELNEIIDDYRELNVFSKVNLIIEKLEKEKNHTNHTDISEDENNG